MPSLPSENLLNWILSQDYLAWAAPSFLLFILLEATISAIRGLKLYTWGDTISSLSSGMFSLLSKVLLLSGLVGLYQWLEPRYGLFAMETWPLWTRWCLAVCLLMAMDLSYYWFHRISHEVNLGWATHIPHHHSEHYNYSTALRQGSFETTFSFWFYLPWAFLGVPVGWYLALASIDTVYQFLVHTQLVRKLPRAFEFFMNTPSHHRVHHARNPGYLDKNYAGMFVFWDRIFGTFKAEDPAEPPVFGTTKVLHSYNPAWAQVDYLATLWQQSREAPRILDKIKIWYKPPGWDHRLQKVGPLHEFDPQRQYQPPATPYLRTVSLLCFGITVVFTLAVRYTQINYVLKLSLAVITVLLMTWICRQWELKRRLNRTS